jgi:cellulose synthase/poly-beta-1,6-N-acetylglucosamine synthase-like glycosyltransferase
MWFSLFLPGLATMSAPIPLGGTSNHFRRDVLEELGAWDPHNVTEDADLGIRLHREGYTVRILDSVTLEEANSDFVNWIKQRSRWYKGYLQTWLVHLRHPRRLVREMGWKGFVQFNLFVGGTPVLAVLNPLFRFMTLYWFVGPEHWANAGHTSSHPAFIKDMFPAPVFYLGLVCFVFGNFITAYLTILTSRLMKRTDLLWAALLVPLYWVMMSIAAIKALIQLISAPTFWEKTTHGLDAAMHRPLKGGKEVGVPT